MRRRSGVAALFGRKTPPALAAPVNTVLPAISGPFQVGTAMFCSTGTWTGYPPPTYAYQWKIAGANVGTNSPFYTPVSGDVGKTPTCVVSATNSQGGPITATAPAGSAITALSSAVNGMVIVGDSLMNGLYTTAGPVAEQFATITGLPGINRAVNGTSLADMDAAYATNVAPYYNATTANSVFFEGGANDQNQGRTAAQMQASITSLCSKARTTGYGKIGVSTPPANLLANQAERTAYITWLRANYVSIGADFLVDFAAMAAFSDPTNLTNFYSDNLHLTNVTTALAAEAVRSAASVALGATDTTPFAFSFTPVTGATISTVYTSDTIYVRGISAPAAISISSGYTYSINGGAYTGASGTVPLGAGVTVRNTSSGSAGGVTAPVLNIGGVTATFSVTTAAAPTSPLSFDTIFVGDISSMVNSSGKVSAWNSLDGNGVSFTQSNAAARPVYDATGGMIFDGSALHLDNDTFPTGGLNTFSAFFLVEIDAAAAGQEGIFCFSNGGNDYQFGGYTFTTNSAGHYLFYSHGALPNGALDPGDTVGCIYDGVNATGYRNNGAGSIDQGPTPYSDTMPATVVARLGSRVLSGLTDAPYFKGKIKKMVLSKLALNSSQRLELQKWMIPTSAAGSAQTITWNAADLQNGTVIANSGRDLVGPASSHNAVRTLPTAATGKKYREVKCINVDNAGNPGAGVGIAGDAGGFVSGTYLGNTPLGAMLYFGNGSTFANGLTIVNAITVSSIAEGDVFQLHINFDAGEVRLGRNGTLFNSGAVWLSFTPGTQPFSLAGNMQATNMTLRITPTTAYDALPGYTV